MALDLSQLRRLFGNNSGQRMTMSPSLLELSEEEDERLASPGFVDKSDVSITTPGPGLLAPDLPELGSRGPGYDSDLGRVNRSRLRAGETPFTKMSDPGRHIVNTESGTSEVTGEPVVGNYKGPNFLGGMNATLPEELRTAPSSLAEGTIRNRMRGGMGEEDAMEAQFNRGLGLNSPILSKHPELQKAINEGGRAKYFAKYGEMPRGPVDDSGEPLSPEAAMDLQRLPEATEGELAITEPALARTRAGLSPFPLRGGLLQTDTTTADDIGTPAMDSGLIDGESITTEETVSEGPQIPEIPLFMKDAANQVQEQAGPELPEIPLNAMDTITYARYILANEGMETESYDDITVDAKTKEEKSSGFAIGAGQHRFYPPDGGPSILVEEGMNFTEEELLASADREMKEVTVPGIIRLIPEGSWDALPPEAQAQLVSVAWNYGLGSHTFLGKNHPDPEKAAMGDRLFTTALREGDWASVGDGMRDLAGDNADKTGYARNGKRRIAEGDAFDAAMAGGAALPGEIAYANETPTSGMLDSFTGTLSGIEEQLGGMPGITPKQSARQRMAEGEDKSTLFNLVTWTSQALPDIDKWAAANGTWEEFSQIRKDKVAAGDKNAAIQRWNAANPEGDTTRGGLLREGGGTDKPLTVDQLREVGYIPLNIRTTEKEKALRLAAESEDVYNYLQSELKKGAFDWNKTNWKTLRDIRRNDPNLGQESPDADIEGWEGVPMALPGQEGATEEGSIDEALTGLPADIDEPLAIGQSFQDQLEAQAGLIDSRAISSSAVSGAVPGSQDARPQRRGLLDDRLAIAQALAQLSAGVAQGGLFGDITDTGEVRGGLVNVMPGAIQTLRTAQENATGEDIPDSNWGYGPAEAEQLFYIGPGGSITWVKDNEGNYVLKSSTDGGSGGTKSGEKASMAQALITMTTDAGIDLMDYYINNYNLSSGEMLSADGDDASWWERMGTRTEAGIRDAFGADQTDLPNYGAAKQAAALMGEGFLRMTTGAAYNAQEYGNAMDLFWVKATDSRDKKLFKWKMAAQFGPMMQIMANIDSKDAMADARINNKKLNAMREMMLKGLAEGKIGGTAEQRTALSVALQLPPETETMEWEDTIGDT